MDKKLIPLLEADEIECRIGTISEKGLSLLLYKDARVDMRILDEVYGTSGWQRRHEMIGNSLYCAVSIWDEEKQQWIEKMDVGTESFTEKEKGQASDAFKRACVNFGIGRELYTAPFIWVGAAKVRIDQKPDERGKPKYYTYDKFRVAEISYNEKREITGLAVVNKDGVVVYRLQENGSAQETGGNAVPPDTVGKQPDDREKAINKELVRTGVALDAVLGRYGVSSINEMDDAVYRKAMNSLKRTKTKAA